MAARSSNLLDGLVVLLVEDDDDSRDLLVAALSMEGARLLEAANVAEACAHLETEEPDIVVSDIGMPDEDGLSFVRRLRAREANAPPVLGAARRRRLPVIALSAFTARSDRERAQAAGFDRYLHKPVDFALLATVISTLARG